MAGLERYDTKARSDYFATDRRTSKALDRLESSTVLRIADAQAEGYVAAAKVRELGHLTREAVNSYAFLRRWADHLGAGDPLLTDELRVFTDVGRIGMAEIIVDTAREFRDEGPW